MQQDIHTSQASTYTDEQICSEIKIVATDDSLSVSTTLFHSARAAMSLLPVDPAGSLKLLEDDNDRTSSTASMPFGTVYCELTGNTPAPPAFSDEK